MTFKLKNLYISSFVNWLVMQSLKGQYSRARTRFVTTLQARLKEYQKFLTELVEKYTEKDEKGKPKVVATEYQFKTDKDKEDYIKELNDLKNEEFILDITDANKGDIKIIKSITLETNYEFGPKETMNVEQMVLATRIAVEYNEWCEALENIK